MKRTIYHCTTDVIALNKMLGTAMLFDDIRQDLLKRSTRDRVLRRYRFSPGTSYQLMSISDKPSIHDFALELLELYDPVFVPDSLYL